MSTQAHGYRVEKDQYQLLLRIPHDRRRVAEDSFRLAGKTPPALPSWGEDEDISEEISVVETETCPHMILGATLGILLRLRASKALHTELHQLVTQMMETMIRTMTMTVEIHTVAVKLRSGYQVIVITLDEFLRHLTAAPARSKSLTLT
ncbi:hypothetical protein B0H11DRAFT_2257101 [Mycena galericulata]|nr:hypothetical protein B0H11DRAFT_2257101 [Mycena galericulata]